MRRAPPPSFAAAAAAAFAQHTTRNQPTTQRKQPTTPLHIPSRWNEQTGETTELGEPKPSSRFHDESFGGAADSEGGPFQSEWREPPGEDKTYTYAGIGISLGVVAGWATQFSH